MSSKETIHTGSGSITFKSGSEGPKWDPYHYDEIEFKREGRPTVLYHSGLGDWVEVEGRRIEPGVNVDSPEQFAREVFHVHTGFWPREIEKFRDKLHSRGCPDHGWRFVRDERGYPGESFSICRHPDHGLWGLVLTSYFNEGAII